MRAEPSRILVVDDDAALLRLLRLFLRRDSGYTTVFLDDPAAALVAVGVQHFDVLVTDYEMPGMSGGQLAREARLHLPDITVISMSGQAPPPENPRYGADEFLAKPFFLPELVGIIERTVRRQSPRMEMAF